MTDLCQLAIACILSVASWVTPQPLYSSGLLVTYGNQNLVEANAAVRGYDLGIIPGRCGLSAIAPVHLGELAWVRVEGGAWQGPCTVIDAAARIHALDSIYSRHEIAEVSRSTAAALGFEYGAQGYLWLGPCPPPAESLMMMPEPYAPPLILDRRGESNPHFDPYPLQQIPVNCPNK